MSSAPKPERVPEDITAAAEPGNGSASPDGVIQLPPEVTKVAEQLEKSPELLKLFVASFRSTTTFGPDPATAKIIAQTEMHQESMRLEGYRETLKSRDLHDQRDHERKESQSKRDHEFRRKKLNHQSLLALIGLVAATAAGEWDCI